MTAFAERSWAALAGDDDPDVAAFDPSTLEGLPAPAQRLLSGALPEGVPLHRSVLLQMEGEIELAGRWLPFTARQILRAGTGFVWAPVVGRRIVRFVGADVLGPYGARTEFRFHGRIPVVRGSGPDIARSAAGRLAAETVAWLPQALTPQAGAAWTGVDGDNAVVSIGGPEGDVDVEIGVADDGRLASLRLQRWNGSAKPPALAPFGGVVDASFTATGGVDVAGRGTVGWDRGTASQDDGEFFRYAVTSATFPGGVDRGSGGGR